MSSGGSLTDCALGPGAQSGWAYRHKKRARCHVVSWQFWNDRITSGIDRAYEVHTHTYYINFSYVFACSDCASQSCLFSIHCQITPSHSWCCSWNSTLLFLSTTNPFRLSAGKLGSFTIDAGHVHKCCKCCDWRSLFFAVPTWKRPVGHLFRYRDKCKVAQISLRGRKDLNGTLSETFKELKDLGGLDLGDTKISGDLAVLANCNKMDRLDLGNTAVTGNLGTLNGAELTWVRLSNTTIAGDVAVLGTWPRIKEVDLSDTEVTGAFDEGSVFENLHILKLTGPRTKIDYMGGGVGPCPFPKMTTLEVSGLAMDASVSEFLAPLLHCQHLSSIWAAGCALTGEVPKTAVFHEGKMPFELTALGKALVFLDLASNRIDKVESIPKRLNTLVLAGNRNMRFAEGVLQKAVQDGILLDVQNVTFTNQTDAQRCMAWFDCKIMWTGVKTVRKG